MKTAHRWFLVTVGMLCLTIPSIAIAFNWETHPVLNAFLVLLGSLATCAAWWVWPWMKNFENQGRAGGFIATFGLVLAHLGVALDGYGLLIIAGMVIAFFGGMIAIGSSRVKTPL